MLKQKTKKNASRIHTLLISSIIIALIAVFGILSRGRISDLFNRSNDTGNVSDSGPTPEQKQTEDATNAADKQKAVDKGAAQPSAPDNTPVVSQSIELSAKQETNNTVTIYTKLFNYSNGTCNLSISNNGVTYAKTAPVIYQSQFSSCAGFSVPVSSLGAGTWQILLQAVSGEINKTQTLSFKVN